MTELSRRRRSSTASLRSAQIALASLVVIAPQLIGGAPPWATIVLTALSGAVAAGAFFLSRHFAGARAATVEPVVLAQLFAVVLTAIHVLPLPARIAEFIAPYSYGHATAAARALGAALPEWVPFTLDAGGSYERFLFGLCILCILCTARLLARFTSPTSTLAGVAASVFLTSVVALAHVGLGATRVYGLHEPRFVAGPVWGPLMNPNNLAGLLALGIPVMLGFACRTDYPKPHRVGWLLASLISLTTAFATLSRAGSAASVLGVVLFGALYLLQRAQRGITRVERAKVLVVAASVLGGAVLLASWSGNDPMGEDYSDITKLQMFGQELRLLREHPWFGLGRGAFAAAATGVYEADSRALFAENLFLQYAIEFGIPAAFLILGTAGARLIMGLFAWRSTVQLGGLVGVFAITMQNAVDFGLELTGVALVAAASLGAALPPFRVRWIKIESRNRPFYSRLLVGSASVAALVACLALGRTVWLTSVSRAERELGTAIDLDDRERFTELFARAVRLHPADASLALLGAAQAVRTGAASAPVWLNRSMMLAPYWSAPHGWAAHWLATVGRWDQALTELQIAAQREPYGTRESLCSLLKKRPLAEVALAVAPAREPERTMVLQTAGECLPVATEASARVDAVLLAAHPMHPQATSRVAVRQLEKGDWEGALRTIGPLLKSSSVIPVAYDVASRAWITSGRPDTAVKLMKTALPQFPDPYEPLLTLANAQAYAGDFAGMRATIENARGASRGDVNRLAWALNALATMEMQSGNLARSLRVWRELYSLKHEPFALSTAAKLANRLGDEAFARQAERELCDLHASAGYCAAAEPH